MDDDSEYDIDISRHGVDLKVDAVSIRRIIIAVMTRLKCPRATISVALVDDPTIADLNQRFLGHDGPTDVITFNLSDDTREDAIHGEIVVSADTAEREASVREHPPCREVLLYVVHGALHLLGMDDHTASDAAAMHALEDEILSAAGVGPVYRTDAK